MRSNTNQPQLPLPYPAGAEDPRAQQLYLHYPDPLALVGADGKLLQVNPAFERLTGQDQTALVGTALQALVGEPAQEALEQALSAAASGNPSDVMAQLTTLAGNTLWVAWSLIALDGDQVFVVGRDITPYKQAEEQLRQREEQLARSLGVAGLATWEIDFGTFTIRLDAHMLTLLGIEDGSLENNSLPIDAFVETYTEGNSANAFFLAMLRMTRSTAPAYEEQIAITLRRSDGGRIPVWFQLQGTAGTNQRIDTAFGTVVREQPAGKHVPPATMPEATPQLERLLRAGRLATFLIDPEELTLQSSPALNAWLGYPSDHPLDWATLAQQHLGATRAVAISQALTSLDTGDFESRTLQLTLKDGRGEELVATCLLQKVPGPTRMVEGILQDITQWEAQQNLLNTQFQELAEAWAATGAFQLRFTEETVALGEQLQQLLEAPESTLPVEDFLTYYLEGGQETLSQTLAALEAHQEQATGHWILLNAVGDALPFQVRLSPTEGGAMAVLVPSASNPAIPGATATTSESSQQATGLETLTEPLARLLLGSFADEVTELPDRLNQLFGTTLALCPGIEIQLWLMDPTAEGCYAAYPAGLPPEDGSQVAAFARQLTAGLQLTPETYAAEPPHAPEAAWLAIPLLREELLVGYLWAEAATPDALKASSWVLVCLALRVSTLIDRETLRETAEYQTSTEQASEHLSATLVATQQELASLRERWRVLETSFEKVLPADIVVKLQGPTSQELPVTVGRLRRTQVELETALEQLFLEVPQLLRRLPDTEAQLAWELLRRSLVARRTQMVPSPNELFPKLEIELTGLGVAQPEAMAEALAQLSWTDGLGAFVVLLKHPDAPVLLAKLAGFRTVREMLSRTDNLMERLSGRAHTLAALQSIPLSLRAGAEHVAVVAALDDMLGVFAPQLQAGVRLERVYEANPEIIANPGMLRLLFLQLLQGTLPRLLEGQLMRIGVRLEGSHVTVRFSDEGTVLPLDLQQQLASVDTAMPVAADLPHLVHAKRLARELKGELRISSSSEQTQLILMLPAASHI